MFPKFFKFSKLYLFMKNVYQIGKFLIMNCLLPELKVKEACEKEVKKKAKIIEVKLVVFEAC